MSDPTFPAESFPETGAPQGYAGYHPEPDADDFAEPPGGEAARIAAEEAAHAANLRAAANEDLTFGRWRAGDCFTIAPSDDPARTFAGLHLWGRFGPVAGVVLDRIDVHHSGTTSSRALLVRVEHNPRPVAVLVDVLSVCARKVSA